MRMIRDKLMRENDSMRKEKIIRDNQNQQVMIEKEKRENNER